MNMRITIRVVSAIVLLGSIAWMIYEPGFEPTIATGGSLITLISSFVGETKTKRKGSQNQELSGQSIGIQAGRDANVKNIKR